jgi:WD repeat-containing protein 68
MNNGDVQVAKNSNYLAPWAAYALDWCKWPVLPNGSSSGKVALGSYLEDSHNFVRIIFRRYIFTYAPNAYALLHKQ